nr:unnamed protein product [Callosobruchus chinensis]
MHPWNFSPEAVVLHTSGIER